MSVYEWAVTIFMALYFVVGMWWVDRVQKQEEASHDEE